jgi:di/tricarboxylate transporter
MSDATISLCVLGGALVLFVSNRFPVELVAMAVALTLFATGVVDLHGAFAGFGDPVVVFLASLFVVSEGLDATGVTAWISDRLGRIVGDDRRRLLAIAMAMTAGLSALISPNGAVAAFLPMVVMTAKRAGLSPSVIAMPTAFAASAGSLLVLTGTPINLLVSEAAVNSGRPGFGFLSFAWVGVPLVLGTIAIATVLAPRLLPRRKSKRSGADLSQHAETLARDYAPLAAGALLDRDRGVAEVVIPPRSRYIGDDVAPGTRTQGGLDVLAVKRGGRVREEAIALRVGDTLLVQGTWDLLDENVRDDDVLVVDSPQRIRRQAVPMGPRARRSLVILIGMVLLLALDLVPAAVAGLLAAGAMVLTRVLSVEQAYRATWWTALILIAGMVPLSTAIHNTGAADILAHLLLRAIGEGGPYALMLGSFVLIAALGQIVSNTATALIVLPVVLSAATEMGVSPRPFLMLVTVACAASFLTPIATPANMMVMGPGGYRFGDYWKLGLVNMAWSLVVSIVVIPRVWPFQVP